MSTDVCTCGAKFMDAEDYRDHLPCLGTKEQQEIAKLQAKLADAEERIAYLARYASMVDDHLEDRDALARENVKLREQLANEAKRCQQESSCLGPQCQLEAGHAGEHCYPITDAFLDAWEDGDIIIGRPPFKKPWWKLW